MEARQNRLHGSYVPSIPSAPEHAGRIAYHLGQIAYETNDWNQGEHSCSLGERPAMCDCPQALCRPSAIYATAQEQQEPAGPRTLPNEPAKKGNAYQIGQVADGVPPGPEVGLAIAASVQVILSPKGALVAPRPVVSHGSRRKWKPSVALAEGEIKDDVLAIV